MPALLAFCTAQPGLQLQQSRRLQPASQEPHLKQRLHALLVVLHVLHVEGLRCIGRIGPDGTGGEGYRDSERGQQVRQVDRPDAGGATETQQLRMAGELVSQRLQDHKHAGQATVPDRQPSSELSCVRSSSADKALHAPVVALLDMLQRCGAPPGAAQAQRQAVSGAGRGGAAAQTTVSVSVCVSCRLRHSAAITDKLRT